MSPAGVYKSHDFMTYISRSTDFGLWPDYQVKFFVQGRISRPINRSKLIFHMRMYRYETSRNIYKSHDLLSYISRSDDFRLWPIFHR